MRNGQLEITLVRCVWAAARWPSPAKAGHAAAAVNAAKDCIGASITSNVCRLRELYFSMVGFTTRDETLGWFAPGYGWRLQDRGYCIRSCLALQCRRSNELR